MARSTLSLGMFAAFAARIAVRRRGLEFGSPPPMRAAMLISRMIRVKTRPRFASVAPFLCLIVAHFECPDLTHPRLFHVTAAWPGSSMEEFLRRRTVSVISAHLRPRTSVAVPPPNIAPTEVRSPGKIAPVLRLTVNRKHIRNHRSLAQLPTPRNTPLQASFHARATGSQRSEGSSSAIPLVFSQRLRILIRNSTPRKIAILRFPASLREQCPVSFIAHDAK